MKLKVLPPTLRKTNHYLILDIKSEFKISKDDLFLYTWDACVRFWGECESSNFNLWVMKHYDVTDDDEFYHYKSILRCQLSYEEKVRAALIIVNKINKKKIAINTIGLSGTIKAGISKYIDE